MKEIIILYCCTSKIKIDSDLCIKLEMFPKDTNVPTFPPLSQNLRFSDRRTFLCFRFMSYFYYSTLLFLCELTIIYGMNTFILICSCVPLIISYMQNVCADIRTEVRLKWNKGTFLLLFHLFNTVSFAPYSIVMEWTTLLFCSV